MRRGRSRSAFVAFALLSLLPAQAFADEPEPPEPPLPPIPQQRIGFESLTGIRVNPLGLETQYSLAYRYRLFASDSVALRDNYIGIGISPTLSPATSRMGGTFEIKPLSILLLGVSVYHEGFFGAFDNLLSYRDVQSANYSDTQRQAAADAGANYPASGLEVQAKAQAQVKLGPVAARVDANAHYFDLDLRGGDRVFYAPRPDKIAQDQGWVVTTDSDILYVSDFGLIAGARFSTASSIYDASVLPPSGDNDDELSARLGPLFAYIFFDEPGASFNKPTILAIAGWWLIHPYRTGQDVHQAAPMGILGFKFEGELWRVK